MKKAEFDLYGDSRFTGEVVKESKKTVLVRVPSENGEPTIIQRHKIHHNVRIIDD